MKKFLKSYCAGFIISILLCGSAYAATYFASSDVAYDNTESGLSSTDVQGAIDELYTECTTTPAGEQIIEDAGLEKDEYECRYFFTGANPNNYISFNDEKAGWRIISVECDGTIKIMRYNSIGNHGWDSSVADWTSPSTLNTYLNSTYYNELNSNAKNQIVAKNWSVGKTISTDKNLANTINNENSIKWNGKIALATVSEYVRSNSNQNSCGSPGQMFMNTEGQCKNTTWMYYPSENWWTLSSDSTATVIYVFGNYGSISINNVYTSFAIRPTLYLSSEIKITGGTGTSSDPYQISL